MVTAWLERGTAGRCFTEPTTGAASAANVELTLPGVPPGVVDARHAAQMLEVQ